MIDLNDNVLMEVKALLPRRVASPANTLACLQGFSVSPRLQRISKASLPPSIKPAPAGFLRSGRGPYRDLAAGVDAGAETADCRASSFSDMVAICSESFFVSAF